MDIDELVRWGWVKGTGGGGLDGSSGRFEKYDDEKRDVGDGSLGREDKKRCVCM